MVCVSKNVLTLISVFVITIAMVTHAYAKNEDAQDKGAETLRQALLQGDPELRLRYRYGNIEQDNKPKESDASTLRAMLKYATKPLYGFSVVGQLRTVQRIGGAYNDGLNNQTDRPVEPDPDSFEIDQLYAQYEGLNQTKASIGRRKLKLNNQRFISDLGWRQNNRSFDGVVVENSGLAEDLYLLYSYTRNVNRALTDDAVKGNFDEADIHMLHGEYKFAPWAELIGYSYLLGIEEDSFAGASDLATNTYGANFKGERALGTSLTALYDFEYAHQDDNEDNSNSFSLDYYRIDLGARYQGLTLKGGHEVLEGDGNLGFSAPLGLLHAFNGFADQFTNTPADGLEDSYAKATYKLQSAPVDIAGYDVFGNTTFHLAYHEFDAENTDQDYGTEWNSFISKKITDNYTLRFDYANFDSQDGFSTDTDKFWVSMIARF